MTLKLWQSILCPLDVAYISYSIFTSCGFIIGYYKLLQFKYITLLWLFSSISSIQFERVINWSLHLIISTFSISCSNYIIVLLLAQICIISALLYPTFSVPFKYWRIRALFLLVKEVHVLNIQITLRSILVVSPHSSRTTIMSFFPVFLVNGNSLSFHFSYDLASAPVYFP